jgi:malate synthase
MDVRLEVPGKVPAEQERVLTQEAMRFVAGLEGRFGPVRRDLLARRELRQADFEKGIEPGFDETTRAIREGDWRVTLPPRDLLDRRVEITGPVERKMMINALNSGANVFMADFEDALSPTWENVVVGQANLRDAVRRELAYESPEGKRYELRDEIATLVVRPRGWHLVEKHFLVDGEPVSASLFDFGLYFFHNATALLDRGSGPYFYLPKLESHTEAELWSEVFAAAEAELGLPHGSVRATVLVETILAAFEMDEILYALRDYAAGLNAGRWDYIFSILRKFHGHAPVFPDRAQVTMTVPFMRAYTDLLVRTCHRRGAHAMGGMAAFVPSRRDAEVNERALAAVAADKEREAADGFDGTWVAHPDLVPVARQVFDRVLGDRPHQKDRLREDVHPPDAVTASRLLDFLVEGGRVTEAGLRNDVSVALQYLNAWLQGSGAVAIFNLMEDAATAEIARSQLWQWVHRWAPLAADGEKRKVDADLYRAIRADELGKLGGETAGRLADATALLDRLVLAPDFVPFLTTEAYGLLE